jgi:hypothetical protein
MIPNMGEYKENCALRGICLHHGFVGIYIWSRALLLESSGRSCSWVLGVLCHMRKDIDSLVEGSLQRVVRNLDLSLGNKGGS